MFKKIVIAYDHNVDQKTILRVKNAFEECGAECLIEEDSGEANDYPVLAKRAYDRFLESGADGMCLLCGTGIGMNIVANKFDGIRSVLAGSEAEAYFARRHEDANAIVFGVGYNDTVYEIKLCRRKMERMIRVFATTEFENAERHKRRVSEIAKLERGGKV